MEFGSHISFSGRNWLILLYVYLFIGLSRALPTVDPGVFVLQGVTTCREGKGYCLLGLACSIDKDFAKDDEGGHCDGLTKSFTSKISFVCCKYVNDSKIKVESYETTISPFTLTDDKFQLLDENPIHLEDEEMNIPDGGDHSDLIDIVGVVTDATGIISLITKPYVPKSSTAAVDTTTPETTTPAENSPTESTVSSSNATTESTASSSSATTESTASSTSAATESTASSSSATTESTASSSSVTTESTASSSSVTTESTASSSSVTTESTASSSNATTESTASSSSATTESTAEIMTHMEPEENTENYNAVPLDIEISEEKDHINGIDPIEVPVEEIDEVEMVLNTIKQDDVSTHPFVKGEAVREEIKSQPLVVFKNEGSEQHGIKWSNQQEILIPLNFLKPVVEDDSGPKVYNDMAAYVQPVTASTNLSVEAELGMTEDFMMVPEVTTEPTQYGLMLPADEEDEQETPVPSSPSHGGLLKPYVAPAKETAPLFKANSEPEELAPKENIDVENDLVNEGLFSSLEAISQSLNVDEPTKVVSSNPLLTLEDSNDKVQQTIDSEAEFDEAMLPHPVNLNICGVKRTFTQHRKLVKKIQAASVYEYCWSAALMKKQRESDQFECSGALIELDLVVTSAACIKRLQNEDLSSYRIVLGDSNLKDDSPYGIRFHDISEVITHPDYLTSGGSHANDIGLIRLKDFATTSENVCLVCVAQKNSYVPDSSCVVTGYTGGDLPRQIRRDDKSPVLPEGVLRVAPVELQSSSDTCTASLIRMGRNPLLLSHPESFLCDKKKKTGRCLDQFDGGSPLVCEAGGRWFLTGISSWSRDCSTDPNVYTKVSAHSDWILSTRLRMYGFVTNKFRYFK